MVPSPAINVSLVLSDVKDSSTLAVASSVQCESPIPFKPSEDAFLQDLQNNKNLHINSSAIPNKKPGRVSLSNKVKGPRGSRASISSLGDK